MRYLTGALLALIAAAPAAAQENAVKSAADAFGERVGVEQAGLYSESQVRGFSLADSGAYRVEGAYFSQASVLDDTILAGVGIRVGVNAARLAYPSPSGVVDYRLRQAGPVDQLRLGVGFRDFGTRVVQGDGSVREGPLSLAGGFVLRPVARFAQGYEGQSFNLGAVAAWDIAPGQRLRAFASLYQRTYDGDYTVVAPGGALPPPQRLGHQYSPAWARTDGQSLNLGLLYNGRVGAYTIDLAAFRSVFDVDRFDYTVISAGPTGQASATTYRSPGVAKYANSVEARLGRSFGAGDLAQLVTLSVRAREVTTDLASYVAAPLGVFDLRTGDPPAVPEPVWAGTRGHDRVEQVTASAGYGLVWGDRVQLRLGAHRVHFDKAVLSVAGVQTDRSLESTFYNASAVVGLDPRTALFGSWVTGLEETGVAPGNASNRDEVLPPGEAKEVELGVRRSLTPQLTLIGAVFDVSRPTQGFRADRSYGLVGQVRHRGVEGSIAGRLDARTNIVVGVVAFQPRVTGPLVQAGVVGSEDAGVSRLVVNANIERQIGRGWSVDAALNHQGARWVDTANTFNAPAFTTLNLGARGRFVLAERPAEFRVLVSNLTDRRGYQAAPSGLLSPIGPRTVRAVLTLTLGPDPSRAD